MLNADHAYGRPGKICKTATNLIQGVENLHVKFSVLGNQTIRIFLSSFTGISEFIPVLNLLNCCHVTLTWYDMITAIKKKKKKKQIINYG